MAKKLSLGVQIALQHATAMMYQAEEAVLALVKEAVANGEKADEFFKESSGGRDIYEALDDNEKSVQKLPDYIDHKKRFVAKIKEIKEIIKEFSQ